VARGVSPGGSERATHKQLLLTDCSRELVAKEGVIWGNTGSLPETPWGPQGARCGSGERMRSQVEALHVHPGEDKGEEEGKIIFFLLTHTNYHAGKGDVTKKLENGGKTVVGKKKK